jgi:hypothetical protein
MRRAWRSPLADSEAQDRDKSDKATPKKRGARARRQGESLTLGEIEQAKASFLADYAKHGNVGHACDMARIHRSTIYRWLEHDEEFLMLHHQAREDYCDSLRHEIYRRAHTGVLKPVYQGGKKVGQVREYSDTLLIFESKARMPEYREKVQLEQTGQVTVSHDFGDDPTTAAIARDLLSRLSGSASDTSGTGASGEQ